MSLRGTSVGGINNLCLTGATRESDSQERTSDWLGMGHVTITELEDGREVPPKWHTTQESGIPHSKENQGTRKEGGGCWADKKSRC